MCQETSAIIICLSWWSHNDPVLTTKLCSMEAVLHHGGDWAQHLWWVVTVYPLALKFKIDQDSRGVRLASVSKYATSKNTCQSCGYISSSGSITRDYTFFHLSIRTAKDDLASTADWVWLLLFSSLGLVGQFFAASCCSICSTFHALSSQRHKAAAIYITPQNLFERQCWTIT